MCYNNNSKSQVGNLHHGFEINDNVDLILCVKTFVDWEAVKHERAKIYVFEQISSCISCIQGNDLT